MTRSPEQFPAIRTAVLQNRKFLRRAVTYLTERGMRQFLDVTPGCLRGQGEDLFAADARNESPVPRTHGTGLARCAGNRQSPRCLRSLISARLSSRETCICETPICSAISC